MCGQICPFVLLLLLVGSVWGGSCPGVEERNPYTLVTVNFPSVNSGHWSKSSEKCPGTGEPYAERMCRGTNQWDVLQWRPCSTDPTVASDTGTTAPPTTIIDIGDTLGIPLGDPVGDTLSGSPVGNPVETGSTNVPVNTESAVVTSRLQTNLTIFENGRWFANSKSRTMVIAYCVFTAVLALSWLFFLCLSPVRAGYTAGSYMLYSVFSFLLLTVLCLGVTSQAPQEDDPLCAAIGVAAVGGSILLSCLLLVIALLHFLRFSQAYFMTWPTLKLGAAVAPILAMAITVPIYVLQQNDFNTGVPIRRLCLPEEDVFFVSIIYPNAAILGLAVLFLIITMTNCSTKPRSFEFVSPIPFIFITILLVVLQCGAILLFQRIVYDELSEVFAWVFAGVALLWSIGIVSALLFVEPKSAAAVKTKCCCGSPPPRSLRDCRAPSNVTTTSSLSLGPPRQGPPRRPVSAMLRPPPMQFAPPRPQPMPMYQPPQMSFAPRPVAMVPYSPAPMAFGPAPPSYTQPPPPYMQQMQMMVNPVHPIHQPCSHIRTTGSLDNLLACSQAQIPAFNPNYLANCPSVPTLPPKPRTNRSSSVGDFLDDSFTFKSESSLGRPQLVSGGGRGYGSRAGNANSLPSNFENSQSYAAASSEDLGRRMGSLGGSFIANTCGPMKAASGYS